jgi:hypothetical protein
MNNKRSFAGLFNKTFTDCKMLTSSKYPERQSWGPVEKKLFFKFLDFISSNPPAVPTTN